ncbi:hypothetical protein P8452_15871 [Trifolium repens]|nr:hypothetical protein QL285_055855 [Trifolium repens]WJX27008.1 hypothetical protein P8452_15871 [Trifolium repens]
MAKWCYKLEEQNGILVQQNLIWKNMIRALDGYQKKNYRRKICKIPNCADLKCPFAHAAAEVRADIHEDFDAGLIGDILPDIE